MSSHSFAVVMLMTILLLFGMALLLIPALPTWALPWLAGVYALLVAGCALATVLGPRR